VEISLVLWDRDDVLKELFGKAELFCYFCVIAFGCIGILRGRGR
jgi:hypothetical protein